jgi:hypothetical protein
VQPPLLADWAGRVAVQLPRGVSTREGRTAFEWDGSNDGGQAVSNGSYWFKFEVRQSDDRVTAFTLGVLVSRPDQPEALGVYNSAGERVARLPLPEGADASAFQLSASSGSGFDAIVPLKGGGSVTIPWDGNGTHGQPLSSGTYWVRAETKGPSRSEAFSLLQGPRSSGSLQVGPNPLGSQGAWRLVFEPRPGQQARAQLYDLSGALVKRAQGPANGRLDLSAEGLAGGVYLLVLQVDGPLPYRLIAKLAVVR